MIEIDTLKFDEKGLIPAIVVNADTKKVLTLAYMNRDSLQISLEKKLTCFWSRSRQELWLKGETSGNYQHIVSITADCDRDALVVMVRPDGPACHLGTESCFEYPVFEDGDGVADRSTQTGVGSAADETTAESGTAADGVQSERGSAAYETPAENEFSCQGLYELIEGRKSEKKEGSYTTYLFEKGLDKILKKVGEESTEVIIAAKAGDKAETVYEIADLAYHVMVLMVEAGISLDEIKTELASRHVIDKKIKQEKMTK